jgi:hypothetical protein
MREYKSLSIVLVLVVVLVLEKGVGSWSVE